jgi:hypothetical protein
LCSALHVGESSCWHLEHAQGWHLDMHCCM